MEYEVVVKYNKTDYLNFLKICNNKNQAASIFNKIFKIIAILFGGFLFLFGIFRLISYIWMLITKNYTHTPPVGVAILIIIIGVAILIKYDYKISGIILWKISAKKIPVIKFFFYEEEFIQHTTISEHKYKYAIIKNIYESKSAYFIFIDDLNGFIINKYGITDPQQFTTFITEKTGLEIIKTN